jgi:hypothetical protein
MRVKTLAEHEDLKKNKSKSGVSRFRQLVERAQFDARLAEDVARSEALPGDVLALLASIKRNLSTCLSKVESRKGAS